MAKANGSRTGRPAQDLTGKQFGRLAVVSRAENSGSNLRWNCLCECGQSVVVQGNNLRRGRTISCGCWRREHSKPDTTTHGMSKTSEYKIWKGIITRCENLNYKHYGSYGGRGISICSEWRNSFEAFLAHVGVRPSAKHSIDRIDNNGNYEPGNVRWATPKEQNRNQRKNRLLTYGGRTATISEWAEITGMSRQTIHQRLALGWSDEEALSKNLQARTWPA